MEFTYERIPDEEMYRFKNRRFLNRKDEYMYKNHLIINNERNIFLVCAGGGGGRTRDPESFVFYYKGIYINFEGLYESEGGPFNGPHYVIYNLYFPMNLANKTTELVSLLKQTLKVFNSNDFKREWDDPIVFRQIAYNAPEWSIDTTKDITLVSIGPALPYKTYQERDKACFAFSQGCRTNGGLYNFRLFYGDAIVDFQAFYYINNNPSCWEIRDVAIPADFASLTTELLNLIPEALLSFSRQTEPNPIQTVNMDNIAISEGPAKVKLYLQSTYLSKFWSIIPNAPRPTRFTLSQEELAELEKQEVV